MVLTLTKKVRKVKEEIVELFPRPVFSSHVQLSNSLGPVSFSDIWHCGVAVSGHQLFAGERNCFWGGLPKSPR